MKHQPEIIRNRNYPVEIHSVTTSDGYILELHRIPSKLRYYSRKPKVVFYQNGLLGTSATGIIKGSGPNRTTDGSLGNCTLF